MKKFLAFVALSTLAPGAFAEKVVPVDPSAGISGAGIADPLGPLSPIDPSQAIPISDPSNPSRVIMTDDYSLVSTTTSYSMRRSGPGVKSTCVYATPIASTCYCASQFNCYSNLTCSGTGRAIQIGNCANGIFWGRGGRNAQNRCNDLCDAWCAEQPTCNGGNDCIEDSHNYSCGQ